MRQFNETGAVWVIADHGELQTITCQLIGKARQLADRLNSSVGCIVLGLDPGSLSDRFFQAGADIVYQGQSMDLRYYQQTAYVQTIIKLARVKKPQIILLGSTPMGRELAPLLAAGLHTGLSAHCIDLCLDENGVLEQKIPAYGGLLTIICPEKRPQMATCAQGVFPMPVMDIQRKGIAIDIAVCRTDPGRVQTLEVVEEPRAGVSLEGASTIVAGGAGACDQEGWETIKAFADTLNAGLGCTRPVADEGWADLNTMIGQSGKMVNPDLYVGVGLSGELQHMVGIMDAKLMIAINKDAKSPVFDQVDYGVVDDCRQFLPVVMEKIKAAREA